MTGPTIQPVMLSPPLQGRAMPLSPSSSYRNRPTPSRSTASRSRRLHSSNSPAENVQVTVRCRPLMRSKAVTRAEDDSCWQVHTDLSQIKLAEHVRRQAKSSTLEYTFDHVFRGSDNHALYETSVKQLVRQSMDGYNATVFAYGQTASGKTYTMMGDDHEPGVIPRAVHDVFDYIKNAVTKEFLLRVSYLEIYNETIRDLLAPANDSLKIHEDKQRGVYVAPLTEEIVTCPQDVLSVIRKGEANRHISTTDYNLHSSRSHTIFQMVIESRERSSTSTTTVRRQTITTGSAKPRMESVKISQLNLIDLAGSEKAASNSERRKEGAYINKSLLTLGTVISKLTENGKSAGHVPYRDSKLTRILQASLSGLAKVVVICTISPTVTSMEESNNTLKFASRVKKIVVSAKNDAVMDDKALIQKYKGEIQELRTKLQTAGDVLVQEKEQTEYMLSTERQQHKQQLSQMQLVRKALKERIDELTRHILNSSTVSAPAPEPSPNKSTGGDDPWTLVRNLRKELEQVKSDRDGMARQLQDADERIKDLEEQAKAKKELADKVAHLEAELSVTKAELQVTRIITKDKSSKGNHGNHNHGSTNGGPPVHLNRLTWDLSALNESVDRETIYTGRNGLHGT